MGAPLIFASPAIPEGRRSDAFCYLFDIFPTLCSVLGVARTDGIDGIDLSSV